MAGPGIRRCRIGQFVRTRTIAAHHVGLSRVGRGLSTRAAVAPCGRFAAARCRSGLCPRRARRVPVGGPARAGPGGVRPSSQETAWLASPGHPVGRAVAPAAPGRAWPSRASGTALLTQRGRPRGTEDWPSSLQLNAPRRRRGSVPGRRQCAWVPDVGLSLAPLPRRRTTSDQSS